MVDWPLTSPLYELVTYCRFTSLSSACATLLTLRSIAPRLQITGLVVKRIALIIHRNGAIFAQWCEDIRRERRIYEEWDHFYLHLKAMWNARHLERVTITKLLNENPSLSKNQDSRAKSNYALSAAIVDQSGLPTNYTVYTALALVKDKSALEKYQSSSTSSSRKSRSSSRNDLSRALKYASKDTRKAEERSIISALHKLMDRRVKVLTNKDIGEVLFLAMLSCVTYPTHLTTSVTPASLVLMILNGTSIGTLPPADSNVPIQSWSPSQFTSVYQMLIFVGLQARRYWDSKLALVSWLTFHSPVLPAKSGEKGLNEVCGGCSKQAASLLTTTPIHAPYRVYKLADQLWIESTAGHLTYQCLEVLSAKAKSLHKRVHPSATVPSVYSYSLQSLISSIAPVYSAALTLREQHRSLLATYLSSDEFKCFNNASTHIGASEVDELLGPLTIPMNNDTAEAIIAILRDFSTQDKTFANMHDLIRAVRSEQTTPATITSTTTTTTTSNAPSEEVSQPIASSITIDEPKVNPQTQSTITTDVISATVSGMDESFIPSALVIFLVGPPGSGKSIHCAELARKFNYIHLQFEPFFYWAVKYAVEAVLSKSRAVSRRNSMDSNILLASSVTEPRSYLPLKNPNLQFEHMLTAAELKTLYLCYDDALPIPSYLRARILYAAMHHIYKHTRNAKFLVDGWLEDEDDWTEWVAISEATLSEDDKFIVESERARNGLSTSSLPETLPRKINFLPPLILRLVCSEKIGMGRWQKVSSSSSDFKSMMASVELRRNQYSLRTRPLLYKLGVTLKEMKRRQSSQFSTTPEKETPNSEALLSFPGMYVKRINAEVSEDAVLYTLTQVFQKLSRSYSPTENAINFDVIDSEDEVVVHLPTPSIIVSPDNTVETNVVTKPVEEKKSASNKLNVLIPPRSTLDIQDTITASPSITHINFTHDDDDIIDDDKEIEHKYYDDDDDEDVPDEKVDDVALISPRILEIQKEEEEKKVKDDAEIDRLKNEVEEVVAEPGQIATRRDDRFTTFISFGLSCSSINFPMPKSGLFSSAPIPSMCIDICRYEPENFDKPWISVHRTEISTVTPTITLRRALVNTWKLCGNEKERPVLFRLWNYTNPSQPIIVAEAQTSLIHILYPPTEAGLVIPFMVSSHIPPVSNGFVIVSSPKLHVLLKANRVVDPKTLQSVLPSHRPLTALQNMINYVDSAYNSSTDQSAVNSPQQLSPALSPRANPENMVFESKENLEPPAAATDPSTAASSSSSDIAPPPKEVAVSAKHRARVRQLEKNIIRQRATSRERRRTIMSELRKQKTVKSVSWVQFKATAHSLPFSHRWDKNNEDVYLCVFKRRNLQSEKNRAKRKAQIRLKAERDLAKKLQNSNRGPSELAYQLKLLKDKWKKEDEMEQFTLESSNSCIKKSHRRFIPPSQFSLIYQSEVHNYAADKEKTEATRQQLFPVFTPFVLPVDKHPLIFVLVSKGCHHERESEREREKREAEGSAHAGKDRILGMVQLDMRDMLRISGIMSLNWDIDVYKEVEEERERAREHRRRLERGENVPLVMDVPFDEDIDKNMVTVRLYNPKTVAEKKKSAAAAAATTATGTRNRAASNSQESAVSNNGDLDQQDVDNMSVATDDNDDENAKNKSGCLSFFSIAFLSEKTISKDSMIADYDPPKERSHRSNTQPITSAPVANTRPRHSSMPAVPV